MKNQLHVRYIDWPDWERNITVFTCINRTVSLERENTYKKIIYRTALKFTALYICQMCHKSKQRYDRVWIVSIKFKVQSPKLITILTYLNTKSEVNLLHHSWIKSIKIKIQNTIKQVGIFNDIITTKIEITKIELWTFRSEISRPLIKINFYSIVSEFENNLKKIGTFQELKIWIYRQTMTNKCFYFLGDWRAAMFPIKFTFDNRLLFSVVSISIIMI